MSFNTVTEKINNICKDILEQRKKYNNVSEVLLEEWKGTAAVNAKVKIDKLDKLDKDIAESYSKDN